MIQIKDVMCNTGSAHFECKKIGQQNIQMCPAKWVTKHANEGQYWANQCQKKKPMFDLVSQTYGV